MTQRRADFILIFWIILLAFICSCMTGQAQSPPQVPLTGNIGVQGSVAVLGGVTVQMPADANLTLTPAQWSNKTLIITSAGTLSATRNIVAPLNKGQEFNVENKTTGGQSLQIIGASGTGVTIANGASATIFSDGTNYIQSSGSSSGASFPATNGIVVNTSTTGSRNAVSSDISNLLVPQASSAPFIWSFGDSIALGAKATNPQGFQDANYAWTMPTINGWGGIPMAYAYGADSSIDVNQTQIMVENSALPGSVAIGDTGLTNDTTEAFGANSNLQNITQRALQGILFWSLTPPSSKNLLQSSTLSGGFALDGVTYHASQGVVSNTNGASFTQNIVIGASGVLEGCYKVTSAATATFTLQIDGVAQTDPISGSTTWITGGDGGVTFNTTNNAAVTNNPATFCAGFRISSLTAGSHSIVVTQTAAGTVNFQWIGTPAVTSSSNPIFVITDVPELGAGIPNAAQTSIFQAMLTTVAGFAATDNQNLYVIGARAALGAVPGTSGYWDSDNIHPTTAGYNKISALALPLGVTFGLIPNTQAKTTPTVLGGKFYAVTPPSTTDVSMGLTNDPSRQQYPSVAINGLRTYSAGKGNSNFSGEATLSGNSNQTHVFGTLGNGGYEFCSWSKNVSGSYIIASTTPTICSAAFLGNSAYLGFENSSPSSAKLILTPGTITISNLVNNVFSGATKTSWVAKAVAPNSSTPKNSGSTCWNGNFWDSDPTHPATNDWFCLQDVISTGVSPVVTFTLTHINSDGPGVPSSVEADFTAAKFKFSSINGTSVYTDSAATLAPGTNVSSVTCSSATCTAFRGRLTISGGTATTGTIAVLTWTATANPMVCTVTQNGGATYFGIGNSVPSTTGMNITADVSVASQTVTINYSCRP